MQEFNINYTISKENWISIMAENEEDAKEELLRLYRGDTPIHSENQIYSQEAVIEGAEWTNDLTIKSYNMSVEEEIEYFTRRAEYAKSMVNNNNLFSDIQRFYQKQYRRCLNHITELKKIQDGSKLIVNLKGIGMATATAVKKEDDKTWYVFDGTIGNSDMDNMDNFLSNIVTKFPQPLQDRLEEIRLLDASEVFSECDDPSQWEGLLRIMEIKLENPQIPYFESANHRQTTYELNDADCSWWLRSVGTQSYFAGVDIDGDAAYGYAPSSNGVRPLFVLKDMED